MAMTESQVSTFSTHIQNNTDPVIVQALIDGTNNIIKDWYNEPISPVVWVLKKDVLVDEIIGAIDWGTDYTAFKDDIEAIRFLLDNGTYDPQAINSREALNSVFAGANSTKLAVLAVCTRNASKVEDIFKQTTSGPGGGDGSSQTGSAIAGFIGPVTLDDVRAAVALIP